MTSDVDTALRRMDKHDLDMRNKRLKRAADLSLKHTYLPYEMQEQHDPWADSSARPPPFALLFFGDRSMYSPFLTVGARACSYARPGRSEEGAAREAGDRGAGPDGRLARGLLEMMSAGSAHCVTHKRGTVHTTISAINTQTLRGRYLDTESSGPLLDARAVASSVEVLTLRSVLRCAFTVGSLVIRSSCFSYSGWTRLVRSVDWTISE